MQDSKRKLQLLFQQFGTISKVIFQFLMMLLRIFWSDIFHFEGTFNSRVCQIHSHWTWLFLVCLIFVWDIFLGPPSGQYWSMEYDVRFTAKYPRYGKKCVEFWIPSQNTSSLMESSLHKSIVQWGQTNVYPIVHELGRYGGSIIRRFYNAGANHLSKLHRIVPMLSKYVCSYV